MTSFGPTGLGPTGLLSQVTPLTKGLLWFTQGAISSEKAYYKDVDYLLNGLLTSTLSNTSSKEAHVLVGENFGKTFYVVVADSMTDSQLQSFFDLIKPQMTEGNFLILIDENGSSSKIQKLAPIEIKSKILTIQ